MKHTHLHILRPKLKIWSMLLPRESCEWAHTLICFAFWRQRSCYRWNFSHPGGFLKTSGFDNDQSFRYLDRGKGRDAEHVVMLRILSGYIKRFFYIIIETVLHSDSAVLLGRLYWKFVRVYVYIPLSFRWLFPGLCQYFKPPSCKYSEFLFFTNASKFTGRRHQTLIIRIAHPLESADRDRERQRKPNGFVEQSKWVNWCFTPSQPARLY